MTTPPLTGPFDTITGLPVHPLVVHAAVVLLPLSALGLILAVTVPRLRPRLAGLSVAGLAVGAVTAWIAEASGEALADRVGVAEAHEELGELLPLAAVLLLGAATGWWWIQRAASGRSLPRWAAPISAALAAGGAVATLVLTALVGHSGAASVWAGRIDPMTTAAAAEAAPVPSPGASSGAGTSSGGPTLAEVARHSSPQDCWSVVDGTVYDLTRWVAQHPGGPGTIGGMCGVDASAAFRGKHGGEAAAARALAGFRVGPLASGAAASGAGSGAAGGSGAPSGAVAAEVTTAYSQAEVARHGSRASCWSTLNGKVYDLTQWVSRHPGGQDEILELCGGPGGEFLEEHAGDPAAEGTLAGFQIGVLR